MSAKSSDTKDNTIWHSGHNNVFLRLWLVAIVETTGFDFWDALARELVLYRLKSNSLYNAFYPPYL
jgi:hypothetical protein